MDWTQKYSQENWLKTFLNNQKFLKDIFLCIWCRLLNSILKYWVHAHAVCLPQNISYMLKTFMEWIANRYIRNAMRASLSEVKILLKFNLLHQATNVMCNCKFTLPFLRVTIFALEREREMKMYELWPHTMIVAHQHEKSLKVFISLQSFWEISLVELEMLDLLWRNEKKEQTWYFLNCNIKELKAF